MTPENEIREAAKERLADLEDRYRAEVEVFGCSDPSPQMLDEKIEKLRAALEATPEGERGDGKGQDYGPSASASDVETIKASARVAEWQPIESAPKDGTWIIGVCGTGENPHGIHPCQWVKGSPARTGWKLANGLHPANVWYWLPIPPVAPDRSPFDGNAPLPNPPTAQPAINIVQSEHVPRGEAFAVSVNGTDENGDPKISAAKITNLAAQPDEKVCGTCGGKGYDVVQSTRGQRETDRIPCLTCQPVPPSEGELSDFCKTYPDFCTCEGEVAAGPWEVRTMGLIWRRDDKTGITCGTIDVTDPRNLIDPQTLCDLLNEYEARPEGHVAVYLPVEVAEEITDPIVAANLEMEIQNATALFKACRQALSNGEGS